MALYQIFYKNGAYTVGCEIFQSKIKAAEFAKEHYNTYDWFIDQIQ